MVVWATSLDASWTDLPLQTVFVPFVHQIATRVGRFADARQWFTVGDVLDLTRHAELTAPLLGAGARTYALFRLALQVFAHSRSLRLKRRAGSIQSNPVSPVLRIHARA